MRRYPFALLVAWCLLLPAHAAAEGNTVWVVDASQATRMQRVERGLPPVPLMDGQSVKMDLEQWMEFFRIPGLSVAVFDNFRMVWMKSYGVREAGTALPVTLDTTFQAASISKPVTAMAVMHLVQEGKLSLDENINDKLVSWKVPDNEFTTREKVTLRRLLSHSAGLTVHGFPGYAVGERLPTTVQVLNGEKPANSPPVRVEMVPGTKYQYSGGGITVVQLMLVDHFKEAFPQLMAETVLQPLGLKHSSYEQPPLPTRAAMSATAHNPGGKPIPGKWHIYPEMAAAGLWTTPGDLAEVAIEVAQSKHGKSNRVLSAASAKQMLTIQADPVGIGFFLDSKSDQFTHNGGNEGFRCLLLAFSESGSGIVIMTNSDNGATVFGPLATSVAQEYGWPSFTPQPTPQSVRFQLIARKLGVAKAIADYTTLRAQGPAKEFEPGDLNARGYELLGAGQTEDAIRVFQANVALYPKDSNGYDSLAEGYMTAGKNDLAIRNYEKSLELNPGNKNAVVMLSRLGVTWQPDPKHPAPVY